MFLTKRAAAAFYAFQTETIIFIFFMRTDRINVDLVGVTDSRKFSRAHSWTPLTPANSIDKLKGEVHVASDIWCEMSHFGENRIGWCLETAISLLSHILPPKEPRSIWVGILLRNKLLFRITSSANHFAVRLIDFLWKYRLLCDKQIPPTAT